MDTPQDFLVYVGTYTTQGSTGIYTYRLDMSSGALTPAGQATATVNPSFLVIHPQRHTLYAVSEVDELAGRPGGAVSAFAIDAQSGELSFLNRQLAHGAAPCHLCIDQSGRFVIVANYNSGSAAMLPIQADGRLGEATDVVQHHGAGADPERQAGPHAHSVTIDLANRYALIADLGLDKIMVYQLDLAQGKLRPHGQASLHAGAGPRHLAFHPNGQYLYAINELDSTMTVFAYDRGALERRQSLSTLPPDFEGTSYCADIHVSQCGRFLYGSNRGHDSIVIFEIDRQTGRLSCVGYEPTRGSFPRNFAIDPSGAFLLAANQNTGNIVTWRIDRQTGQLTPTGHEVQVSMPVCLKFMPRVSGHT